MRTPDTLFARLFGVSLVAIIFAHLLAFLWFQEYGFPPPPPPPNMSEQQMQDFERGEQPAEHMPRPPRPWFGGPVVPLFFQLITLVAVAWFGARALSRPIQRFSDAAERLSENLDSPPLEETGPREARQVAHTFNQMQRRIREQVQQRARMLGAVSHDLRTPLSRLKLRLEQLDNEKLQTQMRQDLDDMIGMLDATLTYLHEQRTSEAQQWYDVQALVESLCENAQDHGADVQAVGTCAPVLVQPMALRSCIGNLLDNALRYGGATVVEILDSRTGVTLKVIDHGPGISADKREAVFEPFYRLEGSRNRNSGGVGLGMTIAREAAQRLGGQLRLEETPGGGLTAIIELPRA
ncbi:sensor histidine kinase [Pseudomonas abieticivorans]|uniref:sensor histidine kinase n=1 Tax=Pseudomonas abieticivorans TaxID=2931382 RepID=UPI0020C0FEEA|nr:HAMP domain-containing sensor histidine kinase [Pseudomonas sp. PIA16]